MIIGIGGASRSGKTTIAQYLKEKLKDAILISQDDFAKPINLLPQRNGEADWEHPDSIDFKVMIDAILRANKNYAYVIVEGFLIYTDTTLMDLFDRRILIKISKDTFVSRKEHDLRWGPVSEEYIEHIWTSHLKYGKVDEQAMDLILNSNEDISSIDFDGIFRMSNRSH